MLLTRTDAFAAISQLQLLKQSLVNTSVQKFINGEYSLYEDSF